MRSRVEIVQIRASEIQAGDVVNRRGPNKDGWIEVASVDLLPDGTYLINDETGRDSFTGSVYSLVWLQVLYPLAHNSHLPVQE